MTESLRAPAVKLHPRSALLQRLERLLDRTAQRLDEVDPPPGPAAASDDVRPVLRLVRPPERLPRADR